MRLSKAFPPDEPEGLEFPLRVAEEAPCKYNEGYTFGLRTSGTIWRHYHGPHGHLSFKTREEAQAVADLANMAFAEGQRRVQHKLLAALTEPTS